MSSSQTQVRLETLVALALAERWPREISAESDQEQESNGELNQASDAAPERESPDINRGLPLSLQDLKGPDRKAAEALLRRYQKLSESDQQRWVDNCLCRIRNSTPARNVRLDSSIHPSQIVDAMKDETQRMQSLILNLLPPTHADPVTNAVEIPLITESATTPGTSGVPRTQIAEVVRQAFFSQFISGESLDRPTPLDLLSGVELARLIRLLGVRETAIACQGVTAVETVTAFLRRFSAEDAHAIASQLAAGKTVPPERIAFAEKLAQTAITEESEVASTMLDRVGLALLAIVLDARPAPQRRYTLQKLPVAAARELEELRSDRRNDCEREMAQSIVQEAESLAANLHRVSSGPSNERRGKPSLNS